MAVSTHASTPLRIDRLKKKGCFRGDVLLAREFGAMESFTWATCLCSWLLRKVTIAYPVHSFVSRMVELEFSLCSLLPISQTLLLLSFRLRKTRGRNTTWKESPMKCTQNISPVPSWVCPSLLFVSKWPRPYAPRASGIFTGFPSGKMPTSAQHSGGTGQCGTVSCGLSRGKWMERWVAEWSLPGGFLLAILFLPVLRISGVVHHLY